MRVLIVYVLLNPIKSVMKIVQNTELPGFKFTIWLGWITGLILARSPKNVQELKSWVAVHTIFPLTLTGCMVVYAVDVILNVMPSNMKKDLSGNFISAAVGNGFAVGHIFLIAILRVYFLLKAKQISAFLVKITNHHSPFAKIDNKKSGIMLLFLFAIACTESVGVPCMFYQLHKTHSWFSSVGDYCYAIMSGGIILWPAYTTHMTAFGMAVTTLDRLLEMFDDFCEYIQSLLSGPGNRQDGLPCDDRTTQITILSQKEMQLKEERHIQARFLLETFQKIQYTFLMYNRVMGPVVLQLTIAIAVGATDGISALLKPKDAFVILTPGWLRWMTLTKCVIYLAILERGHSSRNFVKLELLLIK